MGRHRTLRDRLGLAVLVVGLLVGLYAWGVEPYWIEVTRHSVQASLVAPLRIAHITDLHTYGFGRRERSLLAILERERPDVIVITGDTVIDGDLFGPKPVRPDDPSYSRAAEVLRRLHAPLGVWTVKGNWEAIRRLSDERSFYERNGVRLLSNQVHELRPGVWLAGFDDIRSRPDAGALRQIPSGAFVVALFHSPAYFDAVAGKVSLALAGHTHGGQVRPPFVPPFWLPRGSGRYLAGWYESRGST
jgi:predicted MPP superfamily phosphohydrolase